MKHLGNEATRRTGRSASAAAMRRKKLGIAPVPKPNFRVWTAREIALLGTMPDKDLAALTGHSAGSTKAKRLSLRIAPFRPGSNFLEL